MPTPTTLDATLDEIDVLLSACSDLNEWFGVQRDPPSQAMYVAMTIISLVGASRRRGLPDARTREMVVSVLAEVVVTVDVAVLNRAIDFVLDTLPREFVSIDTNVPAGGERFWVRLMACDADGAFAWQEVNPDGQGGWLDGPRSGSPASDPAREADGLLDVALQTVVIARRDPTNGRLLFDA